MGKNTSIEWTDHSWPVVNGCRRVSPGCENCYAERLIATRLSKTAKYGGLAEFRYPPAKTRVREFNNGSVSLRKVQPKGRPRWTGEARLWEPDLAMPLKIRKPSRIFVADMGDLFYEGVPNEEIAAVFGVMAACPQHTFQVLTKRPARMREWFRWVDALTASWRAKDPTWGHGTGAVVCRHFARSSATWRTTADQWHDEDRSWPLPNVWLGVSVENQATADERIPILLDTPAALRWVSAEPLLGSVEFARPHLGRGADCRECGDNVRVDEDGCCAHCGLDAIWYGLDWVVVGGESGPGARPFDLEWARSIVGQCKRARVPVFVKQLGAKPTDGSEPIPALADRKGGDMDAWPGWLNDLRVREFPAVGAHAAESSHDGQEEESLPAGGAADDAHAGRQPAEG